MSGSDSDPNKIQVCILVVDDDEMTRRFLSHILTQQNYEVETAVDGTEALQKVLQKRYSLVLLDIEMPGSDGLEVLRKIREKYDKYQLPVIMVTANDRSTEIVLALDLGASDYVTKPLDVPVLFARMRAHIATSRGE